MKYKWVSENYICNISQIVYKIIIFYIKVNHIYIYIYTYIYVCMQRRMIKELCKVLKIWVKVIWGIGNMRDFVCVCVCFTILQLFCKVELL